MYFFYVNTNTELRQPSKFQSHPDWFFNDFIENDKYTIVRFYYDSEYSDANSPEDEDFIPVETTSATKSGEDQLIPDSKPGIIKRILNFFGINIK